MENFEISQKINKKKTLLEKKGFPGILSKYIDQIKRKNTVGKYNEGKRVLEKIKKCKILIKSKQKVKHGNFILE